MYIFDLWMIESHVKFNQIVCLFVCLTATWVLQYLRSTVGKMMNILILFPCKLIMFLGWWTTKLALTTKIGKLNKKQNTSYLTCCFEIISQILSEMCQIIKEMADFFSWGWSGDGSEWQLRPWSSPASVCVSIGLNLVWGFHRELLLPSERPPSIAALIVDPPYKASLTLCHTFSLYRWWRTSVIDGWWHIQAVLSTFHTLPASAARGSSSSRWWVRGEVWRVDKRLKVR